MESIILGDHRDEIDCIRSGRKTGQAESNGDWRCLSREAEDESLRQQCEGEEVQTQIAPKEYRVRIRRWISIDVSEGPFSPEC